MLQGTYVAFVALTQDSEDFLGFVGLFESYALYAEGQFGTIPEFYVRPEFRSQGNGRMLLDCAVAYGQGKGWICLAVTTPPLPAFEKSLSFYERQGFSITGGRKLRRPI